MQQKAPKFVGSPCHRGHTLRYAGGNCVECSRLSQASNPRRAENYATYNASEKARVAKARYRRTPKYRASQVKYDATPSGLLRRSLRDRVRKVIKRGKGKRPGSAIRDLGCSIEAFKVHIASQFAVGMSWENYGEWELDHIKPLASFDLSDRAQFLQAVHFTNYQPLWATDNRSKGASLA